MGTIYAEPFIMMSAVFIFLDFIIILAIILLHRKERNNIAYCLICPLAILALLTFVAIYFALTGFGGLLNPFPEGWPYY